MQTGQDKSKNIALIVLAVTIGGFYAAVQNFNQGVKIEEIVFALLYVGVFTLFLVRFVLNKKRVSSPVTATGPSRWKTIVFLILIVFMIYQLFWKETKYGFDWDLFRSAQLQTVPTYVVIEQRQLIDECLTASASLKSPQVNLQKFCECAVGNLFLATEDLKKKGFFRLV